MALRAWLVALLAFGILAMAVAPLVTAGRLGAALAVVVPSMIAVILVLYFGTRPKPPPDQ